MKVNVEQKLFLFFIFEHYNLKSNNARPNNSLLDFYDKFRKVNVKSFHFLLENR